MVLANAHWHKYVSRHYVAGELLQCCRWAVLHWTGKAGPYAQGMWPGYNVPGNQLPPRSAEPNNPVMLVRVSKEACLISSVIGLSLCSSGQLKELLWYRVQPWDRPHKAPAAHARASMLSPTESCWLAYKQGPPKFSKQNSIRAGE